MAQTVFHSPEIVKNILDMRITPDFVAIIGDNGILFYDRPLKRLVSIKVSLGCPQSMILRSLSSLSGSSS